MARPIRAEAPSTPLRVRLSPAEKKCLQIAARVNKQNVSEFARDALVTAANECLETDANPYRPT